MMSIRAFVKSRGHSWLDKVLLIGFLAVLAAGLSWRRSNGHSKATTVKREQFLRSLEKAFYRVVIVPLVAFLPAPVAYGVACRRADWCCRWDTSKREQILRNLEEVLGNQLGPAGRASVARDYFRIRSCEAIDVMRLVGNGRALARLVEIRGLEHIEAALAAGKGAILCSAHFGSFESCFSLISICGFPITVIGRLPSRTSQVDRKRSPLNRFFHWLLVQKIVQRHRHRPYIEPRPGQIGVAAQAAIVLRHNELIGTHLDPPVLAEDHARAVQVDFLGGQALLMPGAITIAQIMGVPVLMVFMRRSSDWQHQVLEISAPIPLEGEATTAFERCLAVVEAAIRQNPAHWLYWKWDGLVELGLLPRGTSIVPAGFQRDERLARA